VTFEEHTRHIDWSLAVGRRRTRHTARRAAPNHAETGASQNPLPPMANHRCPGYPEFPKRSRITPTGGNTWPGGRS